MNIKDLAKKMGLYDKSGFIDDINKINKIDIPAYIKRGLKILQPDAFYFDNYEEVNNPVFLLFFKDIKQEKEKQLHKKIWNFNIAPLVFIIKKSDIEIYNGFKYRKNREYLAKLSLEINDFNYLKLQRGDAWEKYKEYYSSKDRIDYYLLNNIELAIKKLGKAGFDRKYANGVIGRLIFTRYLIDRKIEMDYSFISDQSGKSQRENFLNLIRDKEKLYSHFAFIREKFNGDLFPILPDEKEKLTEEHQQIIYDLFRGVNLRTNQLNMFDLYDFSIIPVELISNIYERFIGEKKRASQKAFYTPLFLVDYILSETVNKEIEKNNAIKVLDPTCGSGIFLVEAYRKMIENNLSEEGNISVEKLKEILHENIYGIDLDENAINITIFSLYLTMLDYIKLDDIDEFRFPQLKGRNFFVADVFDTEAEYNQKIKDTNFDFVYGNPPWGRDYGNHIQYSENKDIPISGKQIAQTFLIRANDFGNEDTIYSFIVTSKILYNLYAKEFRRHFLNNFLLKEVFDLSIVRKIIFERTTGPAAIITYQDVNGQNVKENIVKHISIKPNLDFKMFKKVVIEKNDCKLLLQRYFIEYDWIWKVLLYGNTIDFRFIKKLKEMSVLGDIIKENDLNFGAGFTLRKNYNKKHRPEYGNGNYLRVKTKNLSRIVFNEKDCIPNEKKYFYRTSNENIFNPPHLLIKKGVKYSPVVTFSNEKLIFNKSIYGLSGSEEQENLIKNVGAYLLSDLSRYFLFMQASQWGIERDEIYVKDYLNLPVNKKLVKSSLFEIYNKAIKKIKESENEILNGYGDDIQFFYKKVNQEIANIYNLNDYEIALIDYVRQVSIPLFNNMDRPLKKVKEEEIREYSRIVEEHFKSRFENLNKKVKTDIYLNHYYVCVYFTIKDKEDEGNNRINITEDYTIEKLIDRLGSLSYEQLTSELFIRKDIKGFERNGFYVIKTNEYKNWHRAIAYRDINEFMDSILESGKKKVKNNHV